VEYFRYENSELVCEGVPLSELAEEFGTPLYVYSKNQIISNYRSLQGGGSGNSVNICYALKANANGSILKTLASEGAGADVASAGELYLALKAGFNPSRIVFTGVGKREDEIEFALNENIFCVYAESIQELQLISRIAYARGVTARVGLRVNPHVDAESHPYITTGLSHHKFGIESSKIIEAFQYAASLPSIKVEGVHTHIGSQILKRDPYLATAQYLVALIENLRQIEIPISHIDIGGGFGVLYDGVVQHEGLGRQEKNNTAVPPASDVVAALAGVLEPTGCTIWVEPGRAIVANAGVLLTRVLYTKDNGKKKFAIVDAAMNDLLRPSLYDAYHQIVPLKIETYEQEIVDIVGPVCETGDFLARDRSMLKTKQNDLLAVMTTGAYGFVSSSNYNGRLRPAEIMVSGDKVRVIRQREAFEDLS